MGRKPRRRKTDPKLAVACLRVSKDQHTQANGIEAQRAAIGAWAAKHGVRVVAWHLDEVSREAAFDKRPGLLAAIADLEVHGAGCLVFQKVDRFTSNGMTAALVYRELQGAGAELVFADGNGSGDDETSKLVRSILVAVASFERAMIAARIKAALAVKKRRGEMTGAPPFGYRAVPGPTRVVDGVERVIPVLEPDPTEQAIVRRVKALRRQGVSIRGIVAKLAAAGVVGRARKPLGKSAIQNLVAREVPK